MKNTLIKITTTVLLTGLLIAINPITAHAGTYGRFDLEYIKNQFGIGYVQLTDKGYGVLAEAGTDYEVSECINGINKIPSSALQIADNNGLITIILTGNSFDFMYSRLYGYTDPYVNGICAVAKQQGVWQMVVYIKAGRAIDYQYLIIHEIGHALDSFDYNYSSLVYPAYQGYISQVAAFDKKSNDIDHVCNSSEFFAEAFNWWVNDSVNMKQNAYPLYEYMCNIFDIIPDPDPQLVYETPTEVFEIFETEPATEEEFFGAVREDPVYEEEIYEAEVYNTAVCEDDIPDNNANDINEIIEDNEELTGTIYIHTENDIDFADSIYEARLTDDQLETKLQSILGDQFNLDYWEPDYIYDIQIDTASSASIPEAVNYTLFERLIRWLYKLVYGEYPRYAI